MPQNCRISVLIPVYNTAPFLETAINSILTQTFKDIEVIAVDDCSSDDSFQILQLLAKRDQRLRVFKNAANLQIAKTLNFALQECSPSSKYIARMDSDDIALPQRLERQYAYMESNPQIDISGSYIELFGSRELILKNPTTHAGIVEYMRRGILPLAHPTVIIRRAFIEQHHLRYRLAFCDDYELWIRCLLRYNATFGNLPEILLKYRQHQTQLTSKHNKLFCERTRLLQRQLTKRLPWSQRFKYGLIQLKDAICSRLRS